MKPRTAALLAIAIFLGLVAEKVFRAWKAYNEVPEPPPVSVPAQATPAPASPAPPVAPAADPAAALSPAQSAIQRLLAKLRAGLASPAELAQLTRDLSASDRREAIAAILAFLASGEDAPTGAEFAVGEGGKLTGSPSLRVLLMDLLGAFSQEAGSGEAAALARTVLETPGSADEWAVSLRNVARHEPQSAPFLAEKMRVLLSNPSWLSAPSDGMLEAFDVAVFTRDPSLLPPLAALLDGDNKPLRRAASVALDRLSEAAPLQVMEYLNSHPALMADHPFVRADYFSKADLSDGRQRGALEYYLGRTDVAAAEKSKLLSGLTAPASFVSENLLTAPPPVLDDAPRQEALLKTTAGWIKNGRFPELTGQLQALQERLSLR